MAKLIFVVLMAFSATVKAESLIARTSSYVTVTITTAQGASATRTLQPALGDAKISYANKTGGLTNVEVKMKYFGGIRNAPNDIPVLIIRAESLEINRSGLTSESSGGLIATIPAREGKRQEITPGLVLEITKIEDRELYAGLNPNSKTFRASEAESDCLWANDIAQCILTHQQK